MKNKHHWRVQLQDDTGAVKQFDIRANWDPDHELTKDSVERAAVAEAYMKTNKTHQFVAISSELLEAGIA